MTGEPRDEPHEHDFLRVFIGGVLVDMRCRCGAEPLDLFNDRMIAAMPTAALRALVAALHEATCGDDRSHWTDGRNAPSDIEIGWARRQHAALAASGWHLTLEETPLTAQKRVIDHEALPVTHRYRGENLAVCGAEVPDPCPECAAADIIARSQS